MRVVTIVYAVCIVIAIAVVLGIGHHRHASGATVLERAEVRMCVHTGHEVYPCNEECDPGRLKECRSEGLFSDACTESLNRHCSFETQRRLYREGPQE